MANKYYAISVGAMRVGFTARDGAYPDALLTELGIDDVTANLKGVDMRARASDYCPRINIAYTEDSTKKRRTARLFCQREKLTSLLDANSTATLVGKPFKTGTTITAVFLPRRRTYS